MNRKKRASSSTSEDNDTYHITSGEWLDVGKYKKHVCCDCSLVHVVKYRIHEGKTQESWIRDDKETTKERRRVAAKKRRRKSWATK